MFNVFVFRYHCELRGDVEAALVSYQITVQQFYKFI